MAPKTDPAIRNKQQKQRRSILVAGLLVLVYPFYRFVNYKIPVKPRRIEVNQKPTANGILLEKDTVLFDRDGKSWAVSRKCTHLGCKIHYNEIGGYLECPCHHSRFTPEGEVIQGPAKKHLPVYAVEKRDEAPYYIITV